MRKGHKANDASSCDKQKGSLARHGMVQGEDKEKKENEDENGENLLVVMP